MKKKNLKKLISNLPKRPHILGRNRFFNSAVLIPLVKIEKEYYLLLQKRAANIRQGGDICFPGGRYEEGDKNFKQTALRETFEELGIEKKDIKLLGQLDTFVAPIGTVIESFVGRVKKKAIKNMRLDKNEVEKTLLVPLKFFKEHKAQKYELLYEVKPYKYDENGNKIVLFPVEELGLPKAYKKPWGNKKHKVWVYKYKDEVIWGITAIIIRDLIKRY